MSEDKNQSNLGAKTVKGLDCNCCEFRLEKELLKRNDSLGVAAGYRLMWRLGN